MKIKVTEIDAILSRTDLQGIKVLAPILSYKTTIWKQGQFAKRKLEVIKKCYKTHGTKEALFPTGFIPKIKLYLESVGYKFE